MPGQPDNGDGRCARITRGGVSWQRRPIAVNPANAAVYTFFSTTSTGVRTPLRRSSRSRDTRNSALPRKTSVWESPNGQSLPMEQPFQTAGTLRMGKYPPEGRWPAVTGHPCQSSRPLPRLRTTCELLSAYPAYTHHIGRGRKYLYWPPRRAAANATSKATPASVSGPVVLISNSSRLNSGGGAGGARLPSDPHDPAQSLPTGF